MVLSGLIYTMYIVQVHCVGLTALRRAVDCCSAVVGVGEALAGVDVGVA